MLTRYIAYHYFFKGKEENVIEINNDSLSFLYTDEDRQKSRVTIEGGDVMAVSPKHLLIGASERTTLNACQKTINKLFKDQCCDIERISIVQLPKQRAMMHLDTVMTQVTRNTWVLFKQLLEGESYTKDEQILIDLGANPYNGHTVDPAKVTQFIRKNLEGDYEINSHIKDLKALLTDISVREYGCKEDEVEFIYSADGELIHAEREQWTDSCNVTAIKEGVVLGYDRNDKTALCFKEKGFALIDVEELVNELTQLINNDENANIENFLNDNVPQKSLLMLPSGELSRARGGPHCMTMPIEREALIEKLKPVEYVEEKNAQISLVG
jgi:arginine deiminase